MNEENKEAVSQPEPAPEPIPEPVQPVEPAAGYQQQGGPVAVPVSVKSGGTAALVCGILAAALGFFSPIAGLVLGIVAIVQANKWPGVSKAKAGKICGIVGIVLAALSFVFSIAIVLLSYLVAA